MRWPPPLGLSMLILGACGGFSCASIPSTRYGVNSVTFEGVESFDRDAIAVCLATQERSSASINFDLDESTTCAQPPFEGDRARWELWSWPWTEWALLDRITVEQDAERIERWYAARGYHGASVRVRTTPPDAQRQDLLPEVTDSDSSEGDGSADGAGEGDGERGGDRERDGDGERDGDEERDGDGEGESDHEQAGGTNNEAATSGPLARNEAPCERIDDDEGCEVDIVFEIEEGLPTIIESVEIFGLESIPDDLVRQIRDQNKLKVGDRWDEVYYDRTKNTFEGILFRAGYARAQAKGLARIDRNARTARVYIQLSPGPVCEYGEILVEGAGELPTDLIIAASGLVPGRRFDRSEIREAQSLVYALGAFAGVVAEPVIPDSGDQVPVRIAVTPARETRYSVGGGLESGIVEQGRFGEVQSVNQWDVHLTFLYEHRNLFGGLRRLTLRDRPRVIFGDRFPAFDQPRVGNLVSAKFRQPGFIESSLTLTVDAQHDYGRDAYDTFFRHRFEVGLGLERHFLNRRLFAALGLPRFDYYSVPDGEVRLDGSAPPSDYHLTYLHQLIRLDLRDSNVRPRKGVYIQLDLQEAGYFLPASWDYVRVVPEARAYVPLGKRLVLAGRFLIGALLLSHSDEDLDEESTRLGPRDQRFYGGGSTDVRGYLPGRLGDGRSGGNRKWLASAELRLRVTQDFGVVAFGDAGDVSDGSFRFNVPQFSFGFGLRYHTVVGAIRLDLGWAPASLQVFGDSDPRRGRNGNTRVDFGLFSFPGAVHIALGESF